MIFIIILFEKIFVSLGKCMISLKKLIHLKSPLFKLRSLSTHWRSELTNLSRKMTEKLMLYLRSYFEMLFVSWELTH